MPNVTRYAIVALTVVFAGCTSNSSNNSNGGSTAGSVGPEGGTVGGDSVTVTIPAGALEDSVSLRVERVEVPANAVLPEGFRFTSDVYAFTPHAFRPGGEHRARGGF